MPRNTVKIKTMPTNERLARGDVAVKASGIYYNLAPTTLEDWRERGFLGIGPRAEVRYSAGEILLELAEQTKLMSSNTIDYGRVYGRSVEEEPDVAPIDHIRFIMNKLNPQSAALFRSIMVAPCMRYPDLDQVSVGRAFDDLAGAIEAWKKSDICIKY